MKLDLEIPPETRSVAGCMLECFGNIVYSERVVKVEVKQEESKDDKLLANQMLEGKVIARLQNQQNKPKYKDQNMKYTSRDQFVAALNVYRKFDHVLVKLGMIKDKDLLAEAIAAEEQDEANYLKDVEARRFRKPDNKYNDIMMSLNDLETIPEVPSSAHNAISINLYCIDELYESRGVDFLSYAFKLFPGRDFIILTQPYTFPQRSLLQVFTRIPKKKKCVFDHVLYIFHQDFLWSPTIKVRITKQSDLADIENMIDHLKNRDKIAEDTTEGVQQAASYKIPYTVLCNNMVRRHTSIPRLCLTPKVIGLFVITKSVDLEYYKSHFCIQDFIFISQHSRKAHTKLLHAILNPIF